MINAPKHGSDHNPIIADGILFWNLWAPGTRNGIQSAKTEQAVNVATIEDRLAKEVVHIIELLKAEKEKGNSLDAICLQEVAWADPPYRLYFLQQLNAAFMKEGFNEFIFSIDEHHMPKIGNNVLMSRTGDENFGQLILPNQNKYKIESAKPRDDIISSDNQNGRIFEMVLNPKENSKAIKRTLWNGHLKWYKDRRHIEDLKTIIEQANENHATFAGDTNVARAGNACENIDVIAKNASLFANREQGGNIIINDDGSARMEYVDAIITPKSAPHLQAALVDPEPLSEQQGNSYTPHANQGRGQPNTPVMDTTDSFESLKISLNAQKEKGVIKGIRSEPNGSLRLEIPSKDPNKTLEAYASKNSAQGTSFSFKRNISDDEKKQIIDSVCKIAVDNATDKTVFDISKAPPHLQQEVYDALIRHAAGKPLKIKGYPPEKNILPFQVDFKTPQGADISAQQQADKILKEFEKEINAGKQVAITYSANNIPQAQDIYAGYQSGQYKIEGGNQARVMELVAKGIIERGWQNQAHILPVATSIYAGGDGSVSKEIIDRDLENIAQHLGTGWTVLGLRNQYTPQNTYAIGGGVSKDVWDGPDNGFRKKYFDDNMQKMTHSSPSSWPENLQQAYQKGKTENVPQTNQQQKITKKMKAS